MSKNAVIKGGEFLIKEVEIEDIFIPEEFDEETKMIVDSCKDFLDNEVFPNLERIDKQEDGLMAKLTNSESNFIRFNIFYSA